jgi:dienelactone hydrolase
MPRPNSPALVGIAVLAVAQYAMAQPLPLPDPTVLADGTKCTTVAQWTATRRPELKRLFQSDMYGTLPDSPKRVVAKTLYENPNAFGGTVHLRELELQFDVYGATNPTPIRLLLALPVGEKPVPCFVGIMFCGNHAIAPDEGIRIPDSWQYDKQPGVVKNKASAEGRGKQSEVWPIETITKRGYALAAFYAGDIQPDRPNVDEGLRKVLPQTADTATVISWAWGAQRVVDHLHSEPRIDRERIAVVGHSRLGKAALVAGAFDDRIALTVANQAGCGGSGPSRHNDPKAEAVKRINTSFPHWFCAKFKEYNDATEKLPFDQNGLVALCAPRPVLFTNATEDLWANPAGQFAVLKAAEPAYKLFGVLGCEATAVPEPGKLVDSRLGYFIRPGKHAMTPIDWTAYLDFADIWFKHNKRK